MLADSHLHFFSPGFVETLPDTCRRTSPDEVTLYQAHRVQYKIGQVLAVGYEGLDTYRGNNDYLASLVREHDWIKPVAFASPASLTVEQLEQWDRQGFVGVSMYLFGHDADSLARVPAEVWRWLAERQALVSVNAKGDTWRQWGRVLQAHSSLRLLVSHLGLPGQWVETPASQEVAKSLATVLELAAYSQVQVKLSAFYSISEPSHGYPHRQALPVLDALAGAFGMRRLLWGSDYAPCLEFVSFAQTLAVLDQWPALDSQADRDAVMGGNLLKLLAESRMGVRG